MGQRVIPVAVTAEYIGGDGVTLGAAGSHNSVLVEYDFRSAGPQWEGVSGRYVLWTNPQGNNTNRINLGVSEMVEGYDGVYQAAPPPDAMCVPGWAEMVVVGFTLEDGKEITKVKTEPSRFRVLPGARGSADNEGIATTVADQLQAEIEGVYARLDSKKVNKPVTPYDENGTAGQILETLGDGSTRWRDETVVTEEVVDEVLHNHPEWVTTVQDKSLTWEKMVPGTLGWVIPEMFGAKGDGVTDDSEAVQKAIDTDLPVYLMGTYAVHGIALRSGSGLYSENGGGLVLTDVDDGITGDSLAGITLDGITVVFAAGGSDNTLWGQIHLTSCDAITVRGCLLITRGSRNVLLTQCSNIRIHGNRITSSGGNAIAMNGCTNAIVSDNIATGNEGNRTFHLFDCYAKIADAYDVLYANNVFEGLAGSAIQVTGSPGIHSAKNVRISNCKVREFGGAAFKVDGIDDLVVIDGCDLSFGGPFSEQFQTSAGYGIIVGGGSGEAKSVEVSGCTFYKVSYGFTHATASAAVGDYDISGNLFDHVGRPIRISTCSYDSVRIANNTVRNADANNISQSQLPEGGSFGTIDNFVLDDNVFIGGTDLIVIVQNTRYAEIKRNTFTGLQIETSGLIRLTASQCLVISDNIANGSDIRFGVAQNAAASITRLALLIYGGNYVDGRTRQFENLNQLAIDTIVNQDRAIWTGAVSSAESVSRDLRVFLPGTKLGILSAVRGPMVFLYLVNASGVVTLHESHTGVMSVNVSDSTLTIETTSTNDIQYSVIKLI